MYRVTVPVGDSYTRQEEKIYRRSNWGTGGGAKPLPETF